MKCDIYMQWRMITYVLQRPGLDVGWYFLQRGIFVWMDVESSVNAYESLSLIHFATIKLTL